ncbi:hypothetical protein [Rhizobium sp. LC145]|jgi:hypothetical protein|uniref:hypothetical protein n=1 Tax=Rhizobium sp. LC145 TaxID=1120688 RepID=UPI00062A1038|nr:hypothetical protein [Rhizobium sp. LC145]KKX28819.1 hypothetical protein YH62_17965 [Rhizobium sp. LC145]TKT46317.1 hypothetical protein FDR95_22790 [Rhizobiaceae bacterium LC148]
MNKSFALVAALVASAAYGSAALAAGDYYQGADKNASQSHVDARHTGSINSGNHSVLAQNDQTINRGDYYEGANRPN